jgi:hypothetical protein
MVKLLIKVALPAPRLLLVPELMFSYELRRYNVLVSRVLHETTDWVRYIDHELVVSILRSPLNKHSARGFVICSA